VRASSQIVERASPSKRKTPDRPERVPASRAKKMLLRLESLTFRACD
jgi:hypothetical protein